MRDGREALSPRWPVIACGPVALGGVWLGHTLEQLRVAGIFGVRGGLLAPPHVYMLPAGALLAVLAGLGCLGVWRASRRLDHRIALMHAVCAQVWRGRARSVPDPGRTGRGGRSRLISIWALLTLLQLVLYVLQENLEAVGLGRSPTGLSPITGAHWAAPAVHAAVALLLAAILVIAMRHVGSRERAVAVIAGLARALASRIRRACSPRPRPVWLPCPVDRVGRQLLSRPPPGLPAIGLRRPDAVDAPTAR